MGACKGDAHGRLECGHTLYGSIMNDFFLFSGYLFEDKLDDAIHMLFAIVLVVCGLFETREFDGVLQDCFIK